LSRKQRDALKREKENSSEENYNLQRLRLDLEQANEQHEEMRKKKKEEEELFNKLATENF